MARRTRSSASCSLLVCAIAVLCPALSSADPLAGRWTLNLARTHYGSGAEIRKHETFICERHGDALTCTIRSVRADGTTLVGSFAAAYDGKAYRTEGMPDVDQVRLWKIDEFIADAVFESQGRPTFAYRAIRSTNGRHLTIVSIDPVTRTVLTSAVVYDHQ